MSFNFGKFVQRSTRGLFLFIAIIMIVPLVLWGYMGETEREEDKGAAGVIFGNVPVSKRDYNFHHSQSAASWWWKKYHDPFTRFLMQRGRMPEPPKPEELAKQAWEDIILLHEARSLGITATDLEARLKIREIYQMFTGSYEIREDILDKVATDLFHIPAAAFDRWAADLVVTEKLLDLVQDSAFADYARVYDQLLRSGQLAKVWYAAFDPKDYMRDVKPPRTDEIAAFYQKNKSKYKMSGKVQVAYLMAEFEELQKGVAEPSEAEVKKYYEDNRVEFHKPEAEHAHAPGEKHEENEPPQVKPFDEVKGEIPAKIKLKAAQKKADEIMGRVDTELGATAAANAGKYPDDVFDKLKAKFEAENVKLLHDITGWFDAKQVEDIEKSVGENSTLGSWPFEESQKEGAVSSRVRTSKGVALFRLMKRKDAYDPGVTDRVRDQIVKDLQKEQLRKKTQAAANNVVQEITTHSLAAARAKYPLDWRLTRYFKPGGSDTGIDDPQLAQAISQQISSGQLTGGKKAMVLSGPMLRNKDKADWAYVIYLEDLHNGAPEDVSSQFASSRRNLDAEARRLYREEYIKQVVTDANLVPDASMKTDAKKTEAPAPQP